MKERYKEIGTVILLLVPVLFLFADPYWPYITTVVYLFIFQGYVAWFLLFRCGQFFFGFMRHPGHDDVHEESEQDIDPHDDAHQTPQQNDQLFQGMGRGDVDVGLGIDLAGGEFHFFTST